MTTMIICLIALILLDWWLFAVFKDLEDLTWEDYQLFYGYVLLFKDEDDW